MGAKWFMDTFPNQKDLFTNTSWMIDAFGHSVGNLMIQSAVGMGSMIINRLDDTEKILRSFENKLELEWQYTTKFKNIKGQDVIISNKMLTTIMHSHYISPMNFFKNSYSNANSNPMKVSFVNTINTLLATLAEIDTVADVTTKRIVFMPFGGDFKFKNSASQFQQIDLLILIIQSNNSEEGLLPKIKAQYTNLKKYFEDVKAAS